jgi:hypothetical protein
MVGVGLWIRLGILETPVFQKILDEQRVERVPVVEVFRRQPKQVLLTALLRMPEQARAISSALSSSLMVPGNLGCRAIFC